MNFQQKYFCDIIKGVLHSEKKCQFNSDVDWAFLSEMAKDHNIFPLFVEGASQHTEYHDRSEYGEEMNEALLIVAGQAKRTDTFLVLYRAFVQGGIYPIVMKGLICRQLYGKMCDHRPSGDEDILIRKEEYLKAKEILLSQGFVMSTDDVLEKKLDEVQEISFVHPIKKLHIELHLNPFGTENEVRTNMNESFKHAFDNNREVDIQGTLIHTLNHTEHLLYLILHAFRHFMAGGFGIRQILDILLYQQAFEAEIDINILCEELKEYRAFDFWNDIIYIGNSHLGFSLPVQGFPNCPNELLEDIFMCGIFGNKTQAARTATITTLLATENALNAKSVNPVIRIFRTVFPKKEYLLGVAPHLVEKPWLLPLEWIKRWFRFLKRSKEDSYVIDSMQISRRRLKLLKKYDLA